MGRRVSQRVVVVAGAPAGAAPVLKVPRDRCVPLRGKDGELLVGQQKVAERLMVDAVGVSPSSPPTRYWLQVVNTSFAVSSAKPVMPISCALLRPFAARDGDQTEQRPIDIVPARGARSEFALQELPVDVFQRIGRSGIRHCRDQPPAASDH